MDSDEIVAVCASTNSGNTVGTAEKCSGCGCDIWLSQSTLNTILGMHKGITKADIKLCCGECGLPRIMKGDTKLIPPSSETIKEVMKALNKEDEDFDYRNIQNNIY